MVDEKLIHPLEVFWAPHHGQKVRLAKKIHNFKPLKNLPTFLLNFIPCFRLWSTSVDLTFYVIRKPQRPLHNANFRILVSYVVS